MFDRLGLWLMDRGLREATVDEMVQGFGQRLVEAGISLYRVSLGGMLLHPMVAHWVSCGMLIPTA